MSDAASTRSGGTGNDHIKRNAIVMNPADRLLIGGLRAGHAKAWIIPGTAGSAAIAAVAALCAGILSPVGKTANQME